MTRRPPSPPRGEVVVPRGLYEALLKVARSRLTNRGHVAIQATQEHLGECNVRYWRSGCGPTCIEIRATLEAATALLGDAMPKPFTTTWESRVPEHPCTRCGAVFTPPRLHPRQAVCPTCRDAVKHPAGGGAVPRQGGLFDLEAS